MGFHLHWREKRWHVEAEVVYNAGKVLKPSNALMEVELQMTKLAHSEKILKTNARFWAFALRRRIDHDTVRQIQDYTPK